MMFTAIWYKGASAWSSNFDVTINRALQRSFSNKPVNAPKGVGSKFPSSKKTSYNKTRPSYYCKDYQSNSCTFSEDKHWGYVSGEKVFVEHVCAACMMKRKEVAHHGENSPECPCKGTRGGAQ